MGFRSLRVYYLYMPSIVGKRQGSQTYYYLVESARVDGKPRIVSQQYLGSAAEVLARLSDASAGEPVRTQHKGFGDLAAVWSVLERLNVAGVIDAVVPRYANAAASRNTRPVTVRPPSARVTSKLFASTSVHVVLGPSSIDGASMMASLR
jgi:hypothetical protein